MKKDKRYVIRITGDSTEGKNELYNFTDPESRHPVIATTSKLMTTGVDTQTAKLIVLDQNIQSMTEFKQIIGRGTRIQEDFGKFYFTIMDFKKATELFADKDFDGDPVQIYEPTSNESPVPPDNIDGDDDSSVLVDPEPPDVTLPPDDGLPPKKYYVDDVPVFVVAERVQYYGKDGKLISRFHMRLDVEIPFTDLGHGVLELEQRAKNDAAHHQHDQNCEHHTGPDEQQRQRHLG